MSLGDNALAKLVRFFVFACKKNDQIETCVFVKIDKNNKIEKKMLQRQVKMIIFN